MTIVFVHGAGFDGSVFEQISASFPGSLAPDLPGHLKPGSPSTIAEFAEFLETYVRDNVTDDAVLCGHSMGGAVVIETLLRGTTAARAAVLLGSGARLRVAPAVLEQLEANYPAAVQSLVRHFFAEPLQSRLDWAAGCMERIGQAQTLRDFRACDTFEALDRLAGITVPLLALTGEADQMTPPKYAQALAGRVPQGEARIVPGAGHFVMVERPGETTQAVRAFLSGIP